MSENEIDELFEHLEGAVRKAAGLSDTLRYLLSMAVVEATECVQRDFNEGARRA